MTYAIFPDGYLPKPPDAENATMSTISVWMLAVMPKDDPRRRIVAGIYSYWLERGSVSNRQMDAMRKVFRRASDDYAAGLFDQEVCGGLI